MSIEESIQYWVEAAENDLTAAESNYNSGHYDWCLFIGHLALEKILKAIFVQNTNNTIPPKIHNLIKLAELCDLILSIEQTNFMNIVNKFQFESRYPEYKKEFYKIATKQFTYDSLNKIKEQFLWLKSRIKSSK